MSTHRVRVGAPIFAAEEVIAGDQDPALLLEQAHVRGRVTGRLVDRPGAEVGLDLDAGHERAVGLVPRRDS